MLNLHRIITVMGVVMNIKGNLFSIGKMAEIAKVSVKSLRYYEKINILKPAYIAPDSGYRYYAFNQIYMIEMIKFTIEIGIPLKELTQFFSDGENTFDLMKFGMYAHEAATEKVKKLNEGLRFIEHYGEKIFEQSQYPEDRVYKREISEKFIYVVPFEREFSAVRQPDITKIFTAEVEDKFNESEMFTAGVDFDDGYGLLIEYKPNSIKRFIFAETTAEKSNYKSIPAGKYFCKKIEPYAIERAKEVFSKELSGKDSFIAIETEFFSGKVDISKPASELRMIVT